MRKRQGNETQEIEELAPQKAKKLTKQNQK
jgi:hypothetical protein